MATVQMNIRIDRAVKSAGDAAIRAAGYTPTKTINLLWKYLAEHKNDKKKLDELFDLIDQDRKSKKGNHSKLIKKLAKSNENLKEFCKQNQEPNNDRKTN